MLSTAKSSLTVPMNVSLGSSNHAVIRVVCDRAAGGQRDKTRAAASAHAPVDGVAMDQRTAPAPLGAEALGEHAHDIVEFLAGQFPIRIGRAHQFKELVLLPILGSGAGDNLLGEHVERLLRHLQRIEFDRCGFRAEVPCTSTSSSRLSGKMRPLGSPPRRCSARPTRCRKVASEWVGPIWQTRSTEPMSMPSSSEAVATSALSSPRFRRFSASRRSLAERLPWCDVTLSAPIRSPRLMRNALGQAARIHEDQGRPVRGDQFRQSAINFLPDFIRHYGFERRAGQFDGQIQLTPIIAVDDRARRSRFGSGRESAPLPRSAFASPTSRCAARGCFASAASRSMLRARCEPRRLPTTA